MNTDSKVVRLRQPDEIDDALTDVMRSGARRLLAQAIELEAEVFLTGMRDLTLAGGRARLVRHGHGPERVIQTGIGPVKVTRVKIRDRGAAAAGERVRFCRRSCRNGLAARRAWMRSCRCCICAGSRPATSRRPWRRCSAATRRTSRPR
jgi:hypothetical protein